MRGVFIPPHCDCCCCCSGELESRPLPKLQHQHHNQQHKYYCIPGRATMLTWLFRINLSSGFVFYPNVRISLSERKRKTYSGGRKLKWTKFTLTLTTFKTFHSFSLFVPRGKWQSKKPDCAPHPCQHLVSCVMLARNNILTQKSSSVSAVHIFVGIT